MSSASLKKEPPRASNLTVTTSCFPGASSSAVRAARQWTMRGSLLWLAIIFSSGIAQGQLPGQPTPSPTPVPGFPKIVNQLIDFSQKISKDEGFRFVGGSVAPGSGLTGGVGYNKKFVGHRFTPIVGGSARASIKKYWEFDTNVQSNDSQKIGPEIEDKLQMNFYGVIKDMPRLDFFGIGPNSREQDRAVYHYREAAVGFDIKRPLTTVLDIGGGIEGVFPRIITITNPTIRSVERVYSETTAPGISSQPHFLHLGAFAELHSKGQLERRKLIYKFFFHVYHEGRNDQYSFRRFDADLTNKFPLDRDGKNEFRVRGRLSFSDTSPGQRVPFYLMQTLGGSNIRSVETLRGFRDYRFRDRNLILLQLEYLRNLKGPLDFIAFYDNGKVASAVDSFDVGRWRHTYGLGFVFVQRPIEDVSFRFYLAFGSGEGSRTYVGMADPLGGRGSLVIR